MDLNTGNNDTNKDFLDDETNVFIKFATQLKNSVFGILFIILKEYDYSIYISALLPIIECIQVISFAFNPQFYQAWGATDIAKVVNQILGYIRLLPYIENTNTTVYSAILYVLLAILLLFVLDTAYVSYVYQKKKSPFAWPIYALKIVVTLFISVLYLPFFEYFLSFMACTTDIEGDKVLLIFPEAECRKDIQLVNFILALLATIIFFVITSVATLTLFEGRNVGNNPNSRVTSRANFLFNMYKFVIVVLLNFLPDGSYQIIIIICIFGGSLLVFVMFQFDNPFYNIAIAKVWATVAALNLWTATMLIFAKIMENTAFKESIITWLIGLPLVLLLVLLTNDKRMDFLLINVNQFENGKEIINQVTYLLKLLATQDTSHNSAVLLDGYLEVHKQDCPDENCPLKRKNKQLSNNKVIRNLLKTAINMTEKEAIIVYLVHQIYINGLKKFSGNTTLRISYAFFLLDKMHSKQQALQELFEVEQRNPAFDEEFIVFRYKKIIEDEIAEVQNEQSKGGLDVVSELSFQGHLRMCQANIEKAALLHMEFWSQLSEDQPDLAKLGDIGSKINLSVRNVEEHWGKLMKINPNNTKAMRMLGNFFIEIVHEREKGEELLDRATNLTNVKNNKKNVDFIREAESTNEGTPIIVISGEQDRFAIITTINLAASSLFGFNKSELLNRKINTLMPPIYAKYHDGFIDRYLISNESSIVGKDKERFAFGKNKSNYIFPMHYNMKAIPSIIQGIQFIATLRVEKNLKNTAYVLSYPDGTIDSISSSCISLLKMDTKLILQKKSKIQEFVPNIIHDRANLFATTSNNAKTYAQVTFKYPEGSEFINEDDEKSASLNCYLFDLMQTKNKESAGFQFRFEKGSERSHTLANQEARISNFQFRYTKNRVNIVGEFTDGGMNEAVVDMPTEMMATKTDYDTAISPRNELESGSQFFESQIQFKKQPSESQAQKDHKDYKKSNYATGIKTLRLKDGVVQDIEEEEKSDEEKDEEEANAGGKKGTGFQLAGSQEELQEEGSLADFGNSDKSKKVLTSVINDRSPPSNIKNLKRTAYVVGLIMIGLSIFDYVNILQKVNDVKENISNLSLSHLIIANMMTALSNVRDLYLINLGVLDSSGENDARTQIKISLNAAKVLKDSLELNTNGLSSDHLNLLNNPVVTLNSYSGKTTLKGLVQATEDMITVGLNIAGTSLTSITPTNSDYYFMTVNLLNSYYSSLVQSSQFYAEELTKRTKTDKNAFILILVFAILALAFSMVVMIPIMYSVTKARDHILGLFFDIPSKTVKLLYSKCENFVSNLQVEEDDDMASQLDEDEMERNNEDGEEAEWLTRSRRRRRKKFKNTGRSYRSFFLIYLMIVIALGVIFVYDYISSNALLKNVSNISTEYNSTSFAEFYYSFVNNAQRQLFIDSSVKILSSASEGVVTQGINNMQDLDSQILSENSLNIESHTSDYNSIFRQIIYSDSCSLITSKASESTCKNFADQTITKGMTVAVVRDIENMRILLEAYDTVIAGGAWPFESTYLAPPVDTNTIKNEQLSLFRVPQAQEIAIMQSLYIKKSYRTLVQRFEASLNNQFSNLVTVRLIVFIFFLFEVGVIFLFIWIPMVSRLNTRLWKTKSMLRMIPISVLIKIRNIRIYLRNFLNENHLHE